MPEENLPAEDRAAGEAWVSYPAGGLAIVAVQEGNYLRFLDLGEITSDGIIQVSPEVEPVFSAGRWNEMQQLLRPFVGRPVTEVAEELRTSPRPEPSVMDKLDRAIADLCPCGAEPSEQFYPYCGEACVPSFIGPHTENLPPGALGATQARWRPDLVSQADDTGLVPLTERTREGRVWRQVFRRDGTDQVHLRVDNDNRFVGGDLTREIYENDSLAVSQRWEVLERELTDVRNLVDYGSESAAVTRGFIRLTSEPLPSVHSPGMDQLRIRLDEELRESGHLTSDRWAELIRQSAGRIPNDFLEALEEAGAMVASMGGRITHVDLRAGVIDAACFCAMCTGEIGAAGASRGFLGRMFRRPTA